MSDPFVPYTFRFGRGLNTQDTPAAMEEGQVRVIRNFRIDGQGRLSNRRALLSLASAGAGSEEVCGIFPFPYAAGVAGAVLIWNGSTKVTLYRADANGGLTLEGDLVGYTSGVTTRPRFTGAVLNQALFLCDTEKAYGLTVWDPNGNVKAGGGLFQPTFDFDDEGTVWAAAKPDIVIEHENHLWMFGYGDESDPDRGDVGRFSYLGLNSTGQLDLGDAGTGGATGSTDLFDLADAVPLCAKGIAVTGASNATGRLLVFTTNSAAVVYGSDRASWQKETLSNERGCVNPLALASLAGVDYWMSALGPCRYRGGGTIEVMEAPISGDIEEIDMETVFAVAFPEQYHVRWYYRLTSDTVDGADRCLTWDARTGAFLRDTVGQRVFCGGYLRPASLVGPAGAATGLDHDNISITTARAFWTPGDTGGGTVQYVYRKEGAGAYVLQATYDGSVSEHVHSGLGASTTYTTRIDTVRNGQSPSSGEPVEDPFTTAAAPSAPVITAYDTPIEDEGQYAANVNIVASNRLGTGTLERKLTSQGAGSWAVIKVLGENVASYLDSDVVVGTSYDYRMKNTQEGVDSAWSNVETVTPTDDPPV